MVPRPDLVSPLAAPLDDASMPIPSVEHHCVRRGN
jgi:hypothetical protein